MPAEEDAGDMPELESPTSTLNPPHPTLQITPADEIPGGVIISASQLWLHDNGFNIYIPVPPTTYYPLSPPGRNVGVFVEGRLALIMHVARETRDGRDIQRDLYDIFVTPPIQRFDIWVNTEETFSDFAHSIAIKILDRYNVRIAYDWIGFIVGGSVRPRPNENVRDKMTLLQASCVYIEIIDEIEA